ncbi:MAG TPA: GNAT family N-acetyltransferase [Streptosporangiaceae bacterium]|nr:GNAT family N-acetyltransferase [Streptosporangiaceae bacterium]
MTAKIAIYEQGTLPESLVWQSLSFMRCEWPSLFAGDGRLRSQPFPASIHLACADGPVLLSYAEIIETSALREDRQIRVAGLSNVFTFPPYRREGHASEMVRAANSLIDKQDPGMAILFCEDELVPFYAALGWTAAPAGTITSAAHIPQAMVRQPAIGGTDLVASLLRAPVVVATAW